MILRLVEARTVASPPLEPGLDGVAEWRDLDGRVTAYARQQGERCWVRVPGIALFQFSRGDGRVDAEPEPGASPATIVEHYYRAIVPIALHVRGLEVLHASAVRGPAGVLALAAAKESGKSTLAFALSRRGHALRADDAVAFELAASGATALAIPFDLRLRRDPATLFAQQSVVPVSRGGADGSQPLRLESAPLAGIVVLERNRKRETGEVELLPLAAAPALTALLEHAYCFDLGDRPRKEQMIRQYLELVREVSVYRLSYPSGLAHLPRLVERLDRLVAGES